MRDSEQGAGRPSPPERERSRAMTISTGMAVPVAALILVGSGLFFLAIAVQDVTSVGSLTRDPTVTAEEPWYLGLASTVGAIGWAASASFLALGAWLTRQSGGGNWISLMAGSAFSLLLLIDDVLLLHDDILRRVTGSEEPIYAVYAGLAMWWVLTIVRDLDLATFLTLSVAVFFLSGSVLVDVVWDSDSDARLLTEDGAKFAGIWLWAWFAFVLSSNRIQETLERAGDG